jgi:Uma2 family endonuclease
MGAFEKAVAYIELEEYLALERASRFKHEYLDGVIYTVQGESVRGMAGGSAAHAELIRNTGFALHSRLRGTPCAVMMSDIRLRIDAAGAVFYPDVVVHCGPIARPTQVTELTEARIVVEVMLPGTQRFDRGAKLDAYRRLRGLQHIVLVSSLEPAAWHCRRDLPDGEWTALQEWQPGTELALPSLGVNFSLAEVYDGVELS